MDYIFNPTKDKYPLGVCKRGTKVKYGLKVLKCTGAKLVHFLLHKDGEIPKKYLMNMVFADDKYLYFEYEHKYVTSGHYWYHFEINEDTKLICGDELNAIVGTDDKDFLELIIDKDSSTSKDFRKGIIYHIFVDRFCRKGDVATRNGLSLVDDWNEPVDYEYDENHKRVNRKCYGGNFEGIISKLDYLKSLGASTIYLSPIFEANSSHKYNTADYSKIDEMFGGEKAFKRLVAKAKKLDIKIVLDGVFNHTGSDSVYFNKEGRYEGVGAYQSQSSKYYDWYDFQSYPDKYSTWWGVPTLPSVREESTFPKFIAGKGGIIEKYMNMGVFGLRLDVVDELSDDFLCQINSAVKAVNPNGIVIGEVWENASSKIAYEKRKKYFIGDRLDSVTNYPMKNAIINYVKHADLSELVTTINHIKSEYPKEVQNNLMNILGSHDTMRIMSALVLPENEWNITNHYLHEDEFKEGFKLLKLASILQYTTLGVPTVYYGDEVGMTGGRDPFSRETYPWGGEKKEVLDWYVNLAKLRQNPIICDGDLNILYAKDGVFVFERVLNKDKAFVIINRSEDDYTFTFDGKLTDMLGGNTYKGNITIPPYGFWVALAK